MFTLELGDSGTLVRLLLFFLKGSVVHTFITITIRKKIIINFNLKKKNTLKLILELCYYSRKIKLVISLFNNKYLLFYYWVTNKYTYILQLITIKLNLNLTKVIQGSHSYKYSKKSENDTNLCLRQTKKICSQKYALCKIILCFLLYYKAC